MLESHGAGRHVVREDALGRSLHRSYICHCLHPIGPERGMMVKMAQILSYRILPLLGRHRM